MTEVVTSHVPVPETLSPYDDFSRVGFVVRRTPTDLAKFIPSLQCLFAGNGNRPM
jgi:hypothetical protein